MSSHGRCCYDHLVMRIGLRLLFNRFLGPCPDCDGLRIVSEYRLIV